MLHGKFREFVNDKFHYWGFTEEGIFKGPVTPSLTRGKHYQFTGVQDKNGKDIYSGDIIQFKYYNVYRRWWSNLTDIPKIDAEVEKQKADVKTQLSIVTFNEGGFILQNGYPLTLSDVARGTRFKRGQTNSCDTEEMQWDFEVVGNIAEHPELIHRAVGV